MRKVICLGLMCLAAGAGVAQERSAGGNLEAQMTWSALKSLVDDANARSSAVSTRVDQTNKKVEKLGQDIIAIDTQVKDNTLEIDRMLKCGREDMVYNPTKKACQATTSSGGVWVTTLTCPSQTNMAAMKDYNKDSAAARKNPKCRNGLKEFSSCGASDTSCYAPVTCYVTITDGGDHNRNPYQKPYDGTRMFSCRK